MWDQIWSIITAPVRAVEEIIGIIRNLISTLFGWISNFFTWAARGITDLFAWIANVGWKLFERVGGLEVFVVRAYHDLGDWAVTTAERAFQRAIGYVDNGIRGLSDFFIRGYHDLANWAVTTAENAFQRAYTFALDGIRGLSDFFIRGYHDLQNAINHATDWVVGWVGDRIADAVSPFVQVWRYVTDFVIPTWDRVWPWLVFLANHPFDWWLVALRQVTERGGQWFVGQILKAVQDHSSRVDEWFARWLES